MPRKNYLNLSIIVLSFIVLNIFTFKYFFKVAIDIFFNGDLIVNNEFHFYNEVWCFIYVIFIFMVIRFIDYDLNKKYSLILGIINYITVTYLLLQSVSLSLAYASVEEVSILNVSYLDFKNTTPELDNVEVVFGDYFFLLTMIIFVLILPAYIVSRKKNIQLFLILLITVIISLSFNRPYYDLLFNDEFPNIYLVE